MIFDNNTFCSFDTTLLLYNTGWHKIGNVVAIINAMNKNNLAFAFFKTSFWTDLGLPLLSQAVDWLRDCKHILIIAYPDTNNGKISLSSNYVYRVFVDKVIEYASNETYDSYDSAIENGINDVCIKLLSDNKQ